MATSFLLCPRQRWSRWGFSHEISPVQPTDAPYHIVSHHELGLQQVALQNSLLCSNGAKLDHRPSTMHCSHSYSHPNVAERRVAMTDLFSLHSPAIKSCRIRRSSSISGLAGLQATTVFGALFRRQPQRVVAGDNNAPPWTSWCRNRHDSTVLIITGDRLEAKPQAGAEVSAPHLEPCFHIFQVVQS